jgi:hypothetical protein
MKVKVGNPTATILFYTPIKKYELHASIGDPNNDILEINTDKNLNSPSGTFFISLVPRIGDDQLRWDERLSVFDYVEIRLKGIDDEEEKIVMRGLVDDVRLNEEFGGGVPKRSVVITGRDLGALLDIFKIEYFPELNPVQAILGFISWGFDYVKGKVIIPNLQEAFEFIMKRFNELANITVGLSSEYGHGYQKEEKSLGETGESIRIASKIKYIGRGFFDQLRTHFYNLQKFTGTFWNAIAEWQDKPFHELLSWDEEDYTMFVMRPSRLKDMKRNYHIRVRKLIAAQKNAEFLETAEYTPATNVPGIMYPDDFKVDAEDKISHTQYKNGSLIYNYILTVPLMPISKEQFRSFAIKANLLTPWNSVNPFFSIKNPEIEFEKEPLSWVGRYGYRRYEARLSFIPVDIGQINAQSSKEFLETSQYTPPPEENLLPGAASQSGVAKTKLPPSVSQWETEIEAASCHTPSVDKAFIYAMVKQRSDGLSNKKATPTPQLQTDRYFVDLTSGVNPNHYSY